ncbi:MAG TPA: transcriptional regulator, partial [Pyrinomonadaceae bacterium]
MKAFKAEHPITHFYAFDNFVVDAGKSVLSREGQSVPLTPKAFEILLVLVRNPGRVLKKEELIEEVWPDAFVDENNLPRNISSLRKALGEGPAEHKYIVTLPGQGYRFVAEVRHLDSPNGAPTRALLESVPLEPTKLEPTITVHEDVVKSEPATRKPRSISLLVVCACLALALAISGYFLAQRWLHSSQPTTAQ